MYKILTWTLIFLSLLTLGASSALAFFPLPISGTVLTTDTSGAVQCIGRGIISVMPFNTAPPAPYYISYGTPAAYGYLRPGSFIKGLYWPVPVAGPCFNPETGIPVPVLPIIMYGTNF
jgi:hypothetical protein